MSAYRILQAALLLTSAVNTSAQVVLVEHQLPSQALGPAQVQGTCMDVHGDYVLCGGVDAELYEWNGFDYGLVHLDQAHSSSVALGGQYFALAAHIGGIRLFDISNPSTQLASISLQVPHFSIDEPDHLAFCGNDLAVDQGTFEFRVYDGTLWGTMNSFAPPSDAFFNGTLDADDDEIARPLTDGRVVVYKRNGGWASPTICTTPPITNEFPNATQLADVAIHDGRMVISATDFNGHGYVQIFNDAGGCWAWESSFSFNSYTTGQYAAAHVCFDGDQIFVADVADTPLRGIVRIFRDNGSGVWNEVTVQPSPIDVNSPSDVYFFGSHGMDARDGTLAIGDPTDPPSTAYGSYWFYRTEATQCVELVIEYGGSPSATSWSIDGMNHVGTWSGSEATPTANTDGVYPYDLPFGQQGSGLTYTITVTVSSGGVDGWFLRTCDGMMILNSTGDWTPPQSPYGNGTVCGPGLASGTFVGYGTGCNETMVDFTLPLGPALITSDCGVNQLKWATCGETTVNTPDPLANLFELTAGNTPGPFSFQIFDPDGRFGIMRDAITDCNNNGVGDCERTSVFAASQMLSSWSTFRVRRGRWLDMRARTATTNFGEVCYACFEKRTGSSAGWITCPTLVTFQGGGQHSVISTEYPSIELWPNPANSGTVELRVSDLDIYSRVASIDVIDGLGRTVQTSSVFTDGAEEMLTALELRALVPGLYLVQVRSGDRLFTERLVVE